MARTRSPKSPVDDSHSPDDAVMSAETDATQNGSMANPQTRLTHSVKTALEVLRTFTPENPTRGVIEIAGLLGLHKSTISRMLATLEEERLVRRDPAGEKYQLDLGLLELAGVLLNQLDLRPTALPFLRNLANISKEAVSLAVWDENSTMLIEYLPSPHPIGYLGRIGHRTPAYCSSGGKAMLAYAEEVRVQAVIDAGFRRFTSRTLTTGEELRHELAVIRQRGYSINRGEFWDGVTGVSAPIWDINSSPIAAVSVVGPDYRFPQDRIEEYGQLTKETAGDISRLLGATVRT
jgi:DNA-binding IclR family transcriptional regulator